LFRASLQYVAAVSSISAVRRQRPGGRIIEKTARGSVPTAWDFVKTNATNRRPAGKALGIDSIVAFQIAIVARDQALNPALGANIQ